MTRRIALAVLAAIVAFVVLGPLVWPHGADDIDFSSRNAGASLAHPMGTDQLGRDVAARLMTGGRITLAVGFAAMGLSLGLGVLVGVLAGYLRRLDGWLMRLTDMFLSLPVLPLVMVGVMLFRDRLSATLGEVTGLFALVVLAIGLTSWMPTARVVRGAVLSLRARDFITAAEATGTRTGAMITRHILPNIAGAIMVSAALGMANAIITESALSYLGLGFPPDFPSWGRMLSDGAASLREYPARALWPGLMISLTVLCVTYIGDDAQQNAGRTAQS